MEHLRTRWAALVVALLLILSVAGVAGAAHVILPETAAPQAQEQVANEDGDEDADEDQDEDTTDEESTEAETEDTTEDSEGAQGEHGALVSAVAQNKACIGGPHMNHGWAVSQVARGELAPDLVTGCPVWAPEAAAPETTDTDTDAAAAPGKSGEHRQDAAGKANKANKKHGRP